jgi:hypothetical protein
MQCARCGKEKRASGLLDVKLKTQQKMVCGNCFSELKEEYKKIKSCEECAYLDGEFCKKLDLKLEPDTVIGYKEFFTQAQDCVHFIDSKEYEKKAMKGEVAKTEKETGKEKEITREKEVIIKIRCSYCKNLYDEHLDKCPHCGGT